jgi:hypothetical protein
MKRRKFLEFMSGAGAVLTVPERVKGQTKKPLGKKEYFDKKDQEKVRQIKFEYIALKSVQIRDFINSSVDITALQNERKLLREAELVETDVDDYFQKKPMDGKKREALDRLMTNEINFAGTWLPVKNFIHTLNKEDYVQFFKSKLNQYGISAKEDLDSYISSEFDDPRDGVFRELYEEFELYSDRLGFVRQGEFFSDKKEVHVKIPISQAVDVRSGGFFQRYFDNSKKQELTMVILPDEDWNRLPREKFKEEVEGSGVLVQVGDGSVLVIPLSLAFKNFEYMEKVAPGFDLFSMKERRREGEGEILWKLSVYGNTNERNSELFGEYIRGSYIDQLPYIFQVTSLDIDELDKKYGGIGTEVKKWAQEKIRLFEAMLSQLKDLFRNLNSLKEELRQANLSEGERRQLEERYLDTAKSGMAYLVKSINDFRESVKVEYEVKSEDFKKKFPDSDFNGIFPLVNIILVLKNIAEKYFKGLENQRDFFEYFHDRSLDPRDKFIFSSDISNGLKRILNR